MCLKNILGTCHIGRLRNVRDNINMVLAISVHISTIEPSGTAVTLLPTARAHKIESTWNDPS